MYYIEQAIVVEGKYDKIKLSSLIGSVIITTGGFGVFKDSDKLSLIRHYAKTTGIVIVTDSDAAGFKIRNFLKGAVKGEIKNVYIPDVFGKEKRKAQPSKEGKLGVEGIAPEILEEAFKRAGIFLAERTPPEREIQRLDLYEDGLMGAEDSALKRRALLRKLKLPERLSVTGMTEILNSMMDYEEYKRQVQNLLIEKESK